MSKKRRRAKGTGSVYTRKDGRACSTCGTRYTGKIGDHRGYDVIVSVRRESDQLSQ